MTRLVAFLALAGCLPALAAGKEEEAKKSASNLKSKDAAVRVAALKELGKLGQLQRKLTAPYLTDILSALKDSDPKVRSEAAKTLGLIDPEDKKGAVKQVTDVLKGEKAEEAREGQETCLGELGATAEEQEVKNMARDALVDARKKADGKREQKVIQAALLLITGKKK